MGNTKAPHHRGTYHQTAAKVRAAAYANPGTCCWRCGYTLHTIRTSGRGDNTPKPSAKWTAGHRNDGEIDGALAPECSPCNYGAGAKAGNAKRNPGRTVTNLTLR